MPDALATRPKRCLQGNQLFAFSRLNNIKKKNMMSAFFALYGKQLNFAGSMPLGELGPRLIGSPTVAESFYFGALMRMNCCLFNKKIFLWPAIRFIVNYSKGLFFSYLFVLILICPHVGNLSIFIAALSTFLAALLFAQNLYLCVEVHQDKLTGLDNKNALHVYLEQEVSRVDRNGGYLTLLFFDIDNFKKINDTYGHKVGDSVLIEVGKRLIGNMRNYDKLIRYGGDEFCVICPQLKSEMDSERIQKKLHATLHFSFPVKDSELVIETSLGKATYPTDTESIHGLITIADQRMYKQKKSRKLSRATLSTVNE